MATTPTLLMLLFAVTVLAGEVLAQQAYALVVGIDKYPHFPDDRQLRFAENDARDVAFFLRTPTGGGVPGRNIRLLVNESATRQAILTELESFSRLAESGAVSRLVVFFAGHGVLASTGSSYLMPTNADPRAPSIDGILVDEFIRALASMGVAQINVFVDACRSGGGARGVTQSLNHAWKRDFEAKAGTLVGLFASSNETDSYEDEKLSHGVFTYYLLEGLRGAADGDGNKIVTAAEAYLWAADTIYKHVTRRYHKRQFIERASPYSDNAPLTHAGPKVDSLQRVAVWARERYLMAQALVDKKPPNSVAAKVVLEGLLSRVPDYADAHFLLGQIALEQGQGLNAIVSLSAGLRLDPNRPEAFYALARALERANRYDEAEPYLREALRLKPSDNRTRNRLAELLMKRGQPLEAVIEAQASFERDPEDSLALRILSRGLHDGLGQFEEAYEKNHEWVGRHPFDLIAGLEYLETLFTTARFEMCIPHAKGLRQTPDLEIGDQVVARVFEIACLVARDMRRDASAQLANLITILEQRGSDIRSPWTFQGTQIFVQQSPQVSSARSWLGEFITALSAETSDLAIPRLRELASELKK